HLVKRNSEAATSSAFACWPLVFKMDWHDVRLATPVVLTAFAAPSCRSFPVPPVVVRIMEVKQEAAWTAFTDVTGRRAQIVPTLMRPQALFTLALRPLAAPPL